MSEHLLTFSSISDRWSQSSASAQLDNIEKWTHDGLLNASGAYERENAEELAAAAEARKSSESEVVIVTPHLRSTHATALALWKIITQQYLEIGDTDATEPFDEGAQNTGGYLLIAGIDEELPPGTPVHSNSRFIHKGPAVLPRVSDGLSVSTINIDNGIGVKTVNGNPVAPFMVRRAETAPNVEVLAMLAQNPDLTKIIGSGEAPWLWVPGMHVHDTRGFVTARTPLISGANGELKISKVWNDSGMDQAAIPVFVGQPKRVRAK